MAFFQPLSSAPAWSQNSQLVLCLYPPRSASSPKEMSEVSGKSEKIWDWEGKTQPGIEWHFQPHLHKPYKLRKSRISVSLRVTWLIFHPVASRRCLPCCFSFIEQPRKTLYTPKIFVFETLKIGKCIRWN